MSSPSQPPAAWTPPRSAPASPHARSPASTPVRTSAGRRPTASHGVFGPYRLGKTIGEGEFGKVKLAYHMDTQQEVAIKLIRKESIVHPSRRDKLIREIRILKSLDHPHIVKLFEVIETEHYIGMIMEYISGGELFEHILARRYLKEKEAALFFAQLIAGISYLHKNHIVHRDLKLENLLLDSRKNIVITDFGFANTAPSNPHALMLTSCGSPCYAAPELVISDGYVGESADIWSCGVILYAMLCGYLPFDDDPTNPDGDNINLLYKYILETKLEFPEHVPEGARSLLLRILVPDPRHRADMAEIKAHHWLASVAHIFNNDPAADNSIGSIINPIRQNQNASSPGPASQPPVVPDQELVPIAASNFTATKHSPSVLHLADAPPKRARKHTEQQQPQTMPQSNAHPPPVQSNPSQSFSNSSDHHDLEKTPEPKSVSYQTHNQHQVYQTDSSLESDTQQAAEALQLLCSLEDDAAVSVSSSIIASSLHDHNPPDTDNAQPSYAPDAPTQHQQPLEQPTRQPTPSSQRPEIARIADAAATSSSRSRSLDIPRDQNNRMSLPAPNTRGGYKSAASRQAPLETIPDVDDSGDSAIPSTPSQSEAPTQRRGVQFTVEDQSQNRRAPDSQYDPYQSRGKSLDLRRLPVPEEYDDPDSSSGLGSHLHQESAARHSIQQSRQADASNMPKPSGSNTNARPSVSQHSQKKSKRSEYMRIKTHNGPIDQRALSSRDPHDMIASVAELLVSMGMHVEPVDGEDFKLRVVRPSGPAKMNSHVFSGNESDGDRSNNGHAYMILPTPAPSPISKHSSTDTMQSIPTIESVSTYETQDAHPRAMGANSSNRGSIQSADSKHSNFLIQGSGAGQQSGNPATRLASIITSFPMSVVRRFKYFAQFGPRYDKGFDGHTHPDAIMAKLSVFNASSRSSANNNANLARKAPMDLPEIRFNVSLHRIRNLPGLFVVDFKRLRGDIWEFKRLYHEIVPKLPLHDNADY